jgi:Zn-dependent protease with chaperone function
MTISATMPSDGSMSNTKSFQRIYKHEKTLFLICAIFSAICWMMLIAGTLGIALLYFGFGVMIYLFAHSALISYIKGSGALISMDQYPELHKTVLACSEKIGMASVPEVYLLHGNGIFNAFATRFLGRNFVVLYSDIVDALADNPGAVKFYVGHELGHINQGHLKWMSFLLPARLIPFLGAAYSRAREYTCDRYGFTCCDNANDSVRALAVLAVGGAHAARLNTARYIEQTRTTSGFFMGFHEFLSPYPWLVKRMSAVMSYGQGSEPAQPGRHPLAFVLAATSGSSFLIVLLVLGGIAFTLASSGELTKIVTSAVTGLNSTSTSTLGGPIGTVAPAGAAGTAGAAFPDIDMADPSTTAPAVALSAEVLAQQQASVSAAMASVASVKTAVETYAAANKAWPKDAATISIPETDASYHSDIEMVKIDDGYVHLYFKGSSAPAGAIVTLTSDFDEAEPTVVNWGCISSSLTQEGLPAGCNATPAK